MATPVQIPVTGDEQQGDLSAPFQALVHFYHAFNSGNMEQMSGNWEQSDEVVMDNPLGGIKRGWNEIAPVYEKIFKGSAQVHVEYYDYTIHEYRDVFFAVGRERGYFTAGNTKVDLAIRTTRIFRREGTSWKQVHHHGSIEDPELLAKYQAAVMGE